MTRIGDEPAVLIVPLIVRGADVLKLFLNACHLRTRAISYFVRKSLFGLIFK
jgi:hypothetical protein